MELTQLIQFKAAAEAGNISRAAEKLYISQPALSQSIRRLEEELGVPLFEHRKNRIELNAIGEITLSHVNRILAEIDAMRESVGSQGPLKKELRIASNFKGHTRFAFFALARQFPDVQVEIDIADEDVCVEKLCDGSCDIVFLSMKPERENCESRYIGRLQGAVSVSATDPLYARKEVSLSDLAGRDVYYHYAAGPLTFRMIQLMEDTGNGGCLKPITDDMMYASYFQNQTRGIVFTSNLMEGYLRSFNRKMVFISDDALSFDIWMSYRREDQLLLKPFLRLLEKQFLAVCG